MDVIVFKQFEKGHNPYFNRWFSVIKSHPNGRKTRLSHNPYFNRWFSAICLFRSPSMGWQMSQSLF